MKARKFTRKDLVKQDYKTKTGNKVAFNFTYHPNYSKIKNILPNVNLLLTVNAQHPKDFPKAHIVDFKGQKSLKDASFSVKVSVKKETHGKSCDYQQKLCKVSTFF